MKAKRPCRHSLSLSLTPLAVIVAAGVSLTCQTSAAERYWDPLNDNSYLSTGYTTFAGATMIWNSTGGTTGIGFDTSPTNPANAQWNAGDDGFINITPGGTVLPAPAATWYLRTGTSAPTVHNVTYDSTTANSFLVIVSNSTASAVSNVALTGGTNGASTWSIGAGDTLRLTSGGSVGGSTNVGVVNLVNGTGVASVDFVKDGAGSLHIQSTGSTFTGNVRINAGTLQVNGNGSLGNALNSVYIADGSKLTVNAAVTLSNARTLFLGSAAGTGTAILEAQGTNVFTVDSRLVDNGADADNLQVIANSGRVTLGNPDNAYAGSTTVTSGTLQVANLGAGGVASSIGASSAAATSLVLNGGVLSYLGTQPATTDRLFTIGGTTNISSNSSAAANTLTWTNPGTVPNTATGAHTFTLGGSNSGANLFTPGLTDNGANVLSLVKGGASNWTVTGAHTYTGTTTVGNGTSGGSLEFNGSLAGPGGDVIVQTGNTLRGAGSLARGAQINGTLAPGSAAAPLGQLTLGGPVTFNAGGIFAVNIGGTASSKAVGIADLTLNGNPLSVSLNAANLPSGTSYDVLEYSGTLTGTFSPTVTVGGLGALQSRVAFSLDYGTPGRVRLLQSGQAKNLVWVGGDGVAPGTWNVNGVANWNAGGPETFFDLDTVTFNDTGLTRTVDITADVTPTAIVVNNGTGNDYTISGSTGRIIGPGSLTKSGAGRLVVGGAHAFSGGFSINGGAVGTTVINDATVDGPLGRGLLAFDGGLLDYTGATASTSRPVQLNAAGGTIAVPAATDLTFTGVFAGAGGLVKAGPGTLLLNGANAHGGTTGITEGIVRLGNNNALGGTAAGTTIASGATLDVQGGRALPQDEVVTVAGPGVDTDGDAVGDGAIINTSASTDSQSAIKKLELSGSSTLGGPRRWDVRINGPLSSGFTPGVDAWLRGNGHSLTKTGASIIGFVGVGETDFGDIDIKAGTLIFHDAGNSDPAMMLASDTTLGRPAHKVFLAPGTTINFFNSDGTRSKEIVANGTGTAATIQMNASAGFPPHTLKLDRQVVVDGALTINSGLAGVTNLEFAGAIVEGAAPASVEKIGAGIATLAAANSHTGGTRITAGVLRVGSNAALGSGSLQLNGGALTSSDTNPLTLTNPVTLAANSTIGSATDNGDITVTSPLILGGSFSLAIASTTTLAASFDDGIGDFVLTKSGAGILNLPLASPSSGGITLAGGRTRIGSESALGSGPLTFSGGTLSSDGATPRTIANTVTLTGSMGAGNSVDNGALAFTAPVDAGTARRTVTAHSAVTFEAGMLASGNGGLGVKNGEGTLTVRGTTLQGNSIIQIDDGTLVIDGNLTLNEAVRLMANTTAGNTAHFEIRPGAVVTQTLTTGNLRIGHESATITDGTNTMDLHGTFIQTTGGAGGQVQMGSNSTLARLNLHPGSLLATDAIVLGGLGNAGAATTEVNIDGGTIRALESTATFMQGLTSVSVLAGGVVFDTDGKDITIAQSLQGSGGLTKNGGGTLTFSGINSCSGDSVVNAGVLALGVPQLADGADVAVNGTGRIALDFGAGITDIVDELRFDGVPQASGTWGATGSGATNIDDTRFSGTGTLTVSRGTGQSPYQAWAAANGLDGTPGREAGPLDDPDRDGFQNLLEFGFGGTPLAAADRGIIEVVAADTALDADTDRELTLTMEVRNGAVFTPSGGALVASVDGITYRIEGGLDLATLDSPVSEVTPALPAGTPTPGYTLRTFRVDATNGLPGRGFIRGRVSIP